MIQTANVAISTQPYSGVQNSGVKSSGVKIPATRKTKDRSNRKSRKPIRPDHMPTRLVMDETLHTISLDWAQLSNSTHQDVISGFVQAIIYCRNTQKEELVLRDIAPASKIGRDDPSQVVALYDQILHMFTEAFFLAGRDVPEVRLNLNRGQFDLRFYMGREIPRDCSYEDER